MKKLFTIVLTLLFNAAIYSQWDTVKQIPLQMMHTVHFSGNTIYAGGDTLYISNDNGNTWRSSLSYPNSPVTAIIKIQNTLYAGFYEKGIFRSTDDGNTWGDFNTGLGTWGKLPASFLQWGDTLFYATDGGGVYFSDLTTSSGWVEYNTGLSWNTSYTILSMCKTNNSLIVGAGINGLYYIRPRGGQEWIEKTINYSGPFSVSPKTLLSFGDTVFAGTRAGIFRSVNGGYDWDSVGITAIPLDVTSLTNDGNRIYAGLRRSGDFFVWYSDNMGTTWNFLDHQFSYLNELYVINNRIWAATSDGLWYKDLEITGINDKNTPVSFQLHQNYPNPFNPVTKISYSIPVKSNVNLIVYDMLGREITTLFSGEQDAGEHNIIFNAEHLSSGLYICSLRSEFQSVSIKMILLK